MGATKEICINYLGGKIPYQKREEKENLEGQIGNWNRQSFLGDRPTETHDISKRLIK